MALSARRLICEAAQVNISDLQSNRIVTADKPKARNSELGLLHDLRSNP